MRLLTWTPASGAGRVTTIFYNPPLHLVTVYTCMLLFPHRHTQNCSHSFLYTSPCVNAQSPPIISYTSRPPGPALIVFNASMACWTGALLRCVCTYHGQ